MEWRGFAVAAAAQAYAFLVEEQKLVDVVSDMRGFYRKLANHQHLRWVR